MLDSIFMYVSAWDHNSAKAKGLGIFSFDTKTGDIKLIKKVLDDTAFNQSLIDSGKNFMYVCNETEHVPGYYHASGRIYGFDLDPATGDVSERFHYETGCPSPCFMNFDESGKYAVVAHHSCPEHVTTLQKDENGKWRPVAVCNDSAVELIAVNADGTLGDILDVKKHTKPEITINKTGYPMNNHPHSAQRSPLGNLFCTPDKGDGYVYMYTIDEKKRELVLRARVLSDEEGCAARYCVFHPALPYVFVNHENLCRNDLRVSAFRYDMSGKLERIGVFGGLESAPDTGVVCSQQGMCIDAKGEYLYSICRNPKLVMVFAIDQMTGTLTKIQNAPVDGDFPRGIALSPDGRFVVTTCLEGGEIAVYSVGEDGKLTPTGAKANLVGGSYINFYCPQT